MVGPRAEDFLTAAEIQKTQTEIVPIMQEFKEVEVRTQFLSNPFADYTPR